MDTEEGSPKITSQPASFCGQSPGLVHKTHESPPNHSHLLHHAGVLGGSPREGAAGLDAALCHAGDDAAPFRVIFSNGDIVKKNRGFAPQRIIVHAHGTQSMPTGRAYPAAGRCAAWCPRLGAGTSTGSFMPESAGVNKPPKTPQAETTRDNVRSTSLFISCTPDTASMSTRRRGSYRKNYAWLSSSLSLIFFSNRSLPPVGILVA